MQCQILIFFSWKFVVDSTSQWWVKKIHGSHLRDKKMQHKAGERSLHCFFSFSNISSHLAKKPSYMEINPLSNVGSSIFCLLMFCLESSLREEIFQQEEWGHFWEQLCDQANGHMSTTRAKLNFCVFLAKRLPLWPGMKLRIPDFFLFTVRKHFDISKNFWVI